MAASEEGEEWTQGTFIKKKKETLSDIIQTM